jgi:RimJ/RimL family protein N-acetyltransferase
MKTTTYKYQDKLETQRITTRFLTANDIEAWSHFFEDEDAIEFIPILGLSSNLEKATHMLTKQFERYKENRYGHQAIIDRKTNCFVGICGLLTQDVDGQIETEVGYHIFKKHWGQGYAPEAAKLFIDYAFNNNIVTSIISVIDIGNIKSQRVAEKNGLTIEKKIKYSDGEDVYIYRIKKE